MELVVAVMLFLVSGTHHAPPIQEGATNQILDSKREFSITQREVKCLEKNLWHEARGENFYGILWVAQTTVNRARDINFPHDLCSVVYQKGAFSWSSTDLRYKKVQAVNNIELKVYKQIKLILKVTEILNLIDIDIAQGSLYYHTINTQAYWAPSKIKTKTVGNHIFYRDVK